MALGSPYATERPGLYAVGDVRAGSTKRVASSVGEGSVVVSAIHQYLAALSEPRSEAREAAAEGPPIPLVPLPSAGP